jgi:hypothetical protein
MHTKQKIQLVGILILLFILSLSTNFSSAQIPLKSLFESAHRIFTANNFDPSARGGFLPTAVQQGDLGNNQTSVGRAPYAFAVSPAELNQAITQMMGESAYAMEVYPESNLVYFTTDNPGTWTIIANEPGSLYFAGDFPGTDCCKLYVIDYGLNQLFTIDPATGSKTLIGPAIPYGDEGWSGMTGAMDGTMYASSTDVSRSTLYTIDLSTGAATIVGQITNAPAIIDIAINPQGQMYGVDIVNDNLLQIDPATGSGTVIGSIGFDANYAQGMDFDAGTGTLFMAAFNNSTNQGELRIIDTATGNTTFVGAFPGGAEVDSLAFAPPCCCNRYSISGRITDSAGISIPGVSVTAGLGYSAVTDLQGNYSIGDVIAGSYIVTPTMLGYSFTPPTYTVSMPPDATGVDFTGEQIGTGYSISGHITDSGGNPIPDVSVSAGSEYNAVTDSQGAYTMTTVITGMYAVTPSLLGYEFSPSWRNISVPPDAKGVDFTAEQIRPGYSISGHVTDSGGNPIPDVSVSAGPQYIALTDSQGTYTITGVITGTYTVTPSLMDYTFSPPWRTVTVPPDATGVDFVYLRLLFLPIVVVH